jgi:L-amino acid N-acyltransferase YncA
LRIMYLSRMPIQFIELKENDLEEVRAIYDYYIINTVFTFHTSPITLEGLKEGIFIGHGRYKAFLIEWEEEVCGFCYLTQYKKRPAYDRTAEISVYLKPGFERRGIGTKAITYLETIARQVDIKVLIGVITALNTSSIALFAKMGYEKCAHFKRVGEKFGQVLDVVAYQKIL